MPMLLMRWVMIGAVVVWLIDRLKAGSLHLLGNSIGPPAVTFLAWAGLSLLWSPYKTASAQWFLTLLLYGAVFLMARQSLTLEEHRRTFVWVLLTMGAMEGVLGLVQFLWLGAERATGTFFNPNFFAAYEGAVLVLSLGLLFFTAPGIHGPSCRVLVGTTSAIAAAAFVTAQSRGALVALLAVLLLMGAFRFGKVVMAVLVIAVIVGAVVPNPLRQRIVDVSSHDPYAYTRLDIWKNSLNRSLDHPLGLGLAMYKYGSFQDRFPIEANIVHYRKRAESAHNEYLQLLNELGIVGMGLFLLMIGIWGREALGSWLAQRTSHESGLFIGCAGVVLFLLLHAGMDSVFHEPALVIVLLASAALVHRLCETAHPSWLRWRGVPFLYGRGRLACVVAGGLVLSTLSLQPAAAWYAHELGKQEASQGRYQGAMEWYERAATIDPGTTGYHDSIARTAVELFHETDDPQWLIYAGEEESIARELNRLDARFPYRLGTIYALMADRPEFRQQKTALLAKASTFYAQAIDADPYSPFNYFELAQLYLADGRTDSAIDLLQTATRYEPNYLPGRALLAELGLKQGRPGEYRQELQNLKTLQSTYESQAVDELDRQFLHVDLYPLARALAMETPR